MKENWNKGFDNGEPIAVPASWNDQFTEGRDFLGPAWYQTVINIPTGWDVQNIFLRFGSVNYLSDVWLNEEFIGSHEGGHLPFEFDITEKMNKNENLLVVRVDGNLSADRVPPSGRPFNFPPSNFDFFPYCGIQRPVLLYSVPSNFFSDITVRTDIQKNIGRVLVKIKLEKVAQGKIDFIIEGNGANIKSEKLVEGDEVSVTIDVKNPGLWSPESPNLYKLIVELFNENVISDKQITRG